MSDPPSLWKRLRTLLFGKRHDDAPEQQPVPQKQPAPRKLPVLVKLPARVKIPVPAAHGTPLGKQPNAKPRPGPKVGIAPTEEAISLKKADRTVREPAGPPSAPVVGPPVGLVLGIDFGTSCTKAVIGDPGWKDRSYAVCFQPPGENISAWLHPTRFRDEANLKMRLMDQPDSDEVRDLVSCYLAEVIRYSQKWFEENAPADYRRRTLEWSLNLGFPDKTAIGTRLADAYQKVAEVAVQLASLDKVPEPRHAAKIRRTKVLPEAAIPSRRVKLYPEIAAQLAGYINSPYRHAGSLLLVDVGAGTLDVSTIIIHGAQDEDVVSFHVCEVAPFGALRLFQRRKSELESIRSGVVEHGLEYFQDGVRPVPECLTEMLSPRRRPSQAMGDAFEAASKGFASEVVRITLACLTRFRRAQRDAHEAASYDPWGDRLRFFLTGGGSRSSFYRQYLVDGPLEDDLARFTRWHLQEVQRRTADQGLSLERMPQPKNLEKFPSALSDQFDRLSVAYGLAFGGENLMKVTALPAT